MTRGFTSGYDTIGPDPHAELESYNDSMREREFVCDICGSDNPTKSRHQCEECANALLSLIATYDRTQP